jgi:hypothetical protein
MPYCSLEEAWGSDFKNADYYTKVNDSTVPSSTIHSRIPPELTQNGLSNNSKPSPNIPSYSGGVQGFQGFQGINVNSSNSAVSNIVPYKVNFPDNSKRNYIHPIENQNESEDNLDILEDNENDTRHIDYQRKITPENEKNYITSQDYFLYKKYLNLAEKYKAKLRKRFRDFKESEENNEIMESFSNSSAAPMTTSNDAYSFKDIFIIVIVGIFLIFALDIFVKMGSSMK